MSAPTKKYAAQLHEGIPVHDGARVTVSTIFESNTANIPPLQNPMNAVKHPTPTFRARRDSFTPLFSAPPPVGPVIGVSTTRGGEPP